MSSQKRWNQRCSSSLSRGNRRHFMLPVLWTLLLLWVTWPAFFDLHAQADSPPSEYEVKAGFVYNFGKFVTWPEGAVARSVFVIGIVGDDQISEYLQKITTGKTIDGKSVVIRRYRRASDVQPSHILFISDSEKDHLARILDRVDKQSTLTVSEIDGFIARGGMINFTMVNRKVRFDINEAAANRSGLKISSKLLQLARNVKRD